MTEGLHVVFGTGAIGMAVVEQLAAAGRRVRAVSRRGSAEVPDGVEVMAGDAADHEFATAAASGASVVYQILNPPYTEWKTLFPPLQTSVMTAAAASGAKLVTLENLYGYGPHDGLLTEDFPLEARGKKGSTRAAMTAELMAAHEAGTLRSAIGRASDYFGPRGLLTHMGERVFRPALAGKKASVIGQIDHAHTFSYIPDIAAGLIILGERDEADGRAWHLPNPETLTTRQFIERIYAEIGGEMKISAMSPVMVRVIGLFHPYLREMKEMLYEFTGPYVVDSSRFEQTFGRRATPLVEAIAATVEWFRANPQT